MQILFESLHFFKNQMLNSRGHTFIMVYLCAIDGIGNIWLEVHH